MFICFDSDLLGEKTKDSRTAIMRLKPTKTMFACTFDSKKIGQVNVLPTVFTLDVKSIHSCVFVFDFTVSSCVSDQLVTSKRSKRPLQIMKQATRWAPRSR